MKLAAFNQFCVGHVSLVDGLAVEFHALDVGIVCGIVGADADLLSVRKHEGNLVEEGSGELELEAMSLHWLIIFHRYLLN